MEIYLNDKWVIFNPSSITHKTNKIYYNNIHINRNSKIKFKCDNCNNIVEYSLFVLKRIEYRSVCAKCRMHENRDYHQITKKMKQTKLDKYGDENYTNLKKTKQTKLKKYGDENYNNKSKQIKTNLKKYGVKSSFQIKEVKNKIKQTNLKKYGVKYVLQSEEIKEKIKQTNLKKYGTKYASQSEKVKKKVKQTNLKKYGVEYCFLDKEKIKQTNLKKYGVEYPTQLKEIKEKTKQTNLKKYGVEYISQLKKIKEKKQVKRHDEALIHILNRIDTVVKPLFNINTFDKVGYYDTTFKWQCVKCNTKFKDHLYSHIPRCPTCFPKNQSTSKLEKEVANYIKSLNINLIENNRKILGGKELDIYIPSHNLAIEFDGLYWHSELNGKDKNYHLNKTIECEKQEIQLLHIFEDEWLNKQNIIKNIIKARLGLIKNEIYARKCIIKEINNQENFLNINHIQGYMLAEINIGLYYEDELVSLLAFNKKYDWEIVRYVNKLNISIIGGFAKMLKYFREKYKGDIIIYLDRRLFNGEIYENNGFTKLKSTPPNYYYCKNEQRQNKQQFIRYKLNHSLAESKEWSKIWDCGNNSFYLHGT